jgi:hypothetical protein
MNKTRIKKLEVKTEQRLSLVDGSPVVWRPEEGKIAIGESPFILDKLKSLDREIVYSPRAFSAVLVEATDREVIDRIEGQYLYLVGLKAPISGLLEIVFK